MWWNNESFINICLIEERASCERGFIHSSSEFVLYWLLWDQIFVCLTQERRFLQCFWDRSRKLLDREIVRRALSCFQQYGLKKLFLYQIIQRRRVFMFEYPVLCALTTTFVNILEIFHFNWTAFKRIVLFTVICTCLSRRSLNPQRSIGINVLLHWISERESWICLSWFSGQSEIAFWAQFRLSWSCACRHRTDGIICRISSSTLHWRLHAWAVDRQLVKNPLRRLWLDSWLSFHLFEIGTGESSLIVRIWGLAIQHVAFLLANLLIMSR